MSRDLILEIGCEELPARLIPGLLEELKDLAAQALQAEGLAFEALSSLGTPRRLVLKVEGLSEESEESVHEVRGPSAKIAFDADGNLTRAALGFAGGQGVGPEELVVRTITGGEYVFAAKKIPSRPADALLSRLLPNIISSLTVQRAMRWGNGDVRFIRPVRWIMALFGSAMISFDWAGISSDRLTYGHRSLAPGPFAVYDTDSYEKCLKDAYVILSGRERTSAIRAQGTELADEVGGRVLWTEDLLTEVTYLLEYPTVFLGSFDETYLALPSEVVVTPMKDHQRYFPVMDRAGELLPYFVAVRNGTADHIDTVRSGNEKVLRARLADARFFFDEDRKASLEERVNRLKDIVFQENLGTLYDKSLRLRELVGFLTRSAGLDDMATGLAQRAAWLAKADLTTNMVNEFSELQGIMGREYALAGKEHATVAQAIAEQYLPRFAGDSLPATLTGAVLAMSDKIDTIVGCFGAGRIPSGSEDPYALRRQGTGLIQIVLDQELDISLSELVNLAIDLYSDQDLLPRPKEQVTGEVLDFLEQRVQAVFAQRGLETDVTDAVLAVLPDRPSRAFHRADQVAGQRHELFFADAVQSFTRVTNIARSAPDDAILDPDLFFEQAEKDLVEQLILAEGRMADALGRQDTVQALELLSDLAQPINNFFDQILIMADDMPTRDNRLALMHRVRELGLSVADFSRLLP